MNQYSFQILEEQLRNRDVVHQGANTAVKNLEIHHIAGQTDLRGRVARCDASLSRLSADIKACNDNIKTLALQVTDNTNRIYDRFQSFEQKVRFNS
jgi:peptidoglycan hydrolase CwlO-like protein